MPSRRSFHAIDHSNEMMVPDVTFGFLYQPHSITALLLVIITVAYFAFQDTSQNEWIENLRRGVGVSVFIVLVTGVLVFPSGPFIRPHPIFWRLVFGISMIYMVGVTLLLFQNKEDARKALLFFDSSLNVPLDERPYAEDCSLSYDTIKAALWDRYVLAHFFGWLINSLMIRNRYICWAVSLFWEFTEISFLHMMPNFAECWWDSWIMDLLLCNGIGIEIGYQLCSYLEVQEYRWSGLMEIPSMGGKAWRAVSQFSPESWTQVRWEPWKSLKRFFVANVLIFVLILGQLNGFFIKHLLWIPPENNLNAYRLLLMLLITAPSIRQLYLFIAREDVERLGSQFWVLCTIFALELMLIVKMSQGEFPDPAPSSVKWMWAVFGSIYVLFVLFAATDTLKSKDSAVKKNE